MKNSLLLIMALVGVLSCKGPTPRKPVLHRSSTYFKESVDFNRNLNEQEEQVFEAFMSRDSLNSYELSPNGFWYTGLELSDNGRPKPGDEVVYTYEVYDLEGVQLYTLKDIGQRSYFIDQQELQEGLRLGLKMMTEGKSGTFLFPSHLMFGYLGDADKIGINQPLIYRIQLLKINRGK